MDGMEHLDASQSGAQGKRMSFLVRSIPSLLDGFTIVQRKVTFTCLKENMEEKEVNVAQLAVSVRKMSAYHHGEKALKGTIVGLAQEFVGSNNINLLIPIGKFGTRHFGGKDFAPPSSLFTQLSPLTRHIFNRKDDPLLNYLRDDKLKIEPEWYMPILPMILVNGVSGIGTGGETNIPNFNPRDIVKNLRRMIAKEPLQPMYPWYKNYKGTIEPLDKQRYVVNGEISTLPDSTVEITELPVETWTSNYMEKLDGFLTGDVKEPACITDYREYHTDKTVKFVVEMNATKLREAEDSPGLHTFFKLQTTIDITPMRLFDHAGNLKRYDSVKSIMEEFFELRLKYYAKRKKFMEGVLTAEASRLSNQARFIKEFCNGTVRVENKKMKDLIAELKRLGYDSDPVKAWTKSQQSDTESENEESGPDYDYLVGMPMWNLTEEKKNQILNQMAEKQVELTALQGTTKERLWEEDLDAFLEKLDEVEKRAGHGRNQDNMPSSMGFRVVPRVAEELLTGKKAQKDAEKEAKKAANSEKGEEKGSPKLKKKNRGNPWNDDDSEDAGNGSGRDIEMLSPVAPREKAGGRAAGSKAKKPSSVLQPNSPVAPREKAGGRAAGSKAKKPSSVLQPNSKKAAPSAESEDDDDSKELSSSGSDFGEGLSAKLTVSKAKAVKPPKKLADKRHMGLTKPKPKAVKKPPKKPKQKPSMKKKKEEISDSDTGSDTGSESDMDVTTGGKD